jgi:hypothetical protein
VSTRACPSQTRTTSPGPRTSTFLSGLQRVLIHDCCYGGMSLRRSIKSRVARFDQGLVARQVLSIAYKCMFSVDSMLLAALSHSQALVLQQAFVSTFGNKTFTQVMRRVASKSQYRYPTALHEVFDVTHAQTSPVYHRVSPRRITIDALQAHGWVNSVLNSGSDTILRNKMHLSFRFQALGNTASGYPMMDLPDAISPRTSPC